MLLCMDDFILFSNNFWQHLQELKEVLDTLRKGNITINASKSKFMQCEISYLGMTLNAQGLAVNKDKILAIQQLKKPRNLEQLRSFLGQTQFHRRHIKQYSKIVAPLYALITKHNDEFWCSN